MSSSRRSLQVAERLRELISMMLIRGDIADPRIKNVTIYTVKATDDLQMAKVYFSVLGTEAERQDALVAFKKAAGFIRNQMGKSLQLRYTPELNFYLDDSVETSMHMAGILNEIEAERKKNPIVEDAEEPKPPAAPVK